MTDLIARLEELTGPDRDVDEVIFREHSGKLLQQFSKPPPRYTASIDAAMSLVPEKMCWTLAVNTVSSRRSVANVMPTGPDNYGVADKRTRSAEATTPAIALTIAALKARGIK